ncbi:MAG: class I tRNA ligase family protein [Planctomycetes bacterium]|nr:class I tRNA ligase family protein [Planctomycetota bacterium]
MDSVTPTFPKHLPPAAAPHVDEPPAGVPCFRALVPPPEPAGQDGTLLAASHHARAAARFARMEGKTAALLDRYPEGAEAREIAALAFTTLHRNRLLRRVDTLFFRCPRCRKVPGDEAAHATVRARRWTVKYAVSGEPARFFSVPTSSPETIFADVALAASSDHARAGELSERACDLPLAGRKIAVLAGEDDFVGTPGGVRRVTPAEEADSLALARSHKIDPVLLFDEKGLLGPASPAPFRGLTRDAAREAVLAALEKEGLLEGVEEVERPAALCPDCREVLDPVLSGAWRVQDAEAGREVAAWIRDGKIEIRPLHEAANLARSLEGLSGWAISTESEEGPRVPAWRCGDCGVLSAAASLPTRCPRCEGERLSRDRLVLSDEFTSLALAAAASGWIDASEGPARPPGLDLLAVPQSRWADWLARFLVLGSRLVGGIPVSSVLVLSPARGGATPPDPHEDVESLAAALSGTAGVPRAPGPPARAAARRMLDKLWNLGRFAAERGSLLPGADSSFFNPKSEIRNPQWEDRWILGAAESALREAGEAYRDGRPGDAARAAARFIRREIGAVYLPILRLRARTGLAGAASPDVHMAAVDAATRMFYPLAPGTVRELRERLGSPRPSSPTWPACEGRFQDPRVARQGSTLAGVPAAARRILARGRRPAGPYSLVVWTFDESTKEELLELPELLAALSGAAFAAVEATTSARPDWIAETAGDLLVHAVFSGESDRGADRAALQARQGALRRFLQGARSRLSSPEFHSRASPEVVERTRRSTRVRLRLLSAIEGALGSIQGDLGTPAR